MRRCSASDGSSTASPGPIEVWNERTAAGPMTKLLELLGKSVRSAEAVAELARYPSLEHELDDAAADEGIPPVHYLRGEDDGLLIKLSDDGVIIAIFMMSEGKDGFSQFFGELPGR